MYTNVELISLQINNMAVFICAIWKPYGCINSWCEILTLQWRHNGCDGISNQQPHHCLLNRLFRRRSKKTSKLRVTGLYAGNSPVIASISDLLMYTNVELISLQINNMAVFICAIWKPYGCINSWCEILTLQWRHNGCDGISNQHPHRCLLNRIFRRRSKKTSKLRVTGLYAGNSPVTVEFPAQMASNAENISIW